MRTLLALLAFAALASGCIQPGAQMNDATPQPPPASDRVEGMTAQATQVDKDVGCSSGGSVPPQFCAERNLTVTGRIGVAALPVSLVATNGGVVVRAGEGDAWSFHAVVRVAAPTQELATQGLDTAWTWRHEKAGHHELFAGPTSQDTPRGPLPVAVPVGAHVVAARYDLVLPAWVVLDTLGVQDDNGGITVAGFHAGKVDLANTNGGMTFTGSASDLAMSTTNGGLQVNLAPTSTGKVAVKSTNGGIAVHLRLGSDNAADVDGKSTNGGVSLNLRGGSVSANERTHKHFRSDGFEGAPIQTTLTAETTNGGIVIDG